MKNSLEKIQDLRDKNDLSIHKTAQLQQIIAQIEATLSREENQKVIEKSQQQ